MIGSLPGQIRSVYDRMQDEQSKDIYGLRLLYSLTGDYRYIVRLVQSTEGGSRLKERLASSDQEKIVFGTGFWAGYIIESNPQVRWSCCVDNHPVQKEYLLPVISFQELLEKHKDALIVISTRVYHEEIHKQLLNSGFDEKNIVDAGEIINQMQEGQYFDLPQLGHSEHEVFIDGGGFDGMTSLIFSRWAKTDNNQRIRGGGIWIFEPDSFNVERYLKQLKIEDMDLNIVTKGLWNTKEILRFASTANALSKIEDYGETEVEVTSIDECLKGERVTFIKLDIEGAELKALEGAEQTIKRYKPKLAICIYHKQEDVWKIPNLILLYNPDYKFYLRHYSLGEVDTVLYAL